MTRRTRGLLSLGGLATLGLGALYAVVFHAPLYTLMPHSPRDTAHLFVDRPELVAHRGWSGVAPENTVAAFRKAAEAGYAIELDVTLARSGEIVVIHDDTVDRTTDGTGAVEDLDWSTLESLDAGSWFDPRFAGEPLPTLQHALDAIPRDSLLLVELKTSDDKQSLPRAVAEVLQRDGRTRVLVISFDPFLLEQLRLAAPELPRGQLVGTYEDSDLAWYEKRALQNLAFTEQVQQDVVLWQHTMIDEARMKRMTAAGYPVVAWTVNEPEDLARIDSLGVSAIISDHPERVR